ncbi:hypothetical protein OKW35_009675 [Paraburkholderia sp. MM5477-R1]
MTTERSNSRIVCTDHVEVGCIHSGRDAPNISRPHQRSDTPVRSGKSPHWAWANCRSEFDWMDVHLPFFTSEWF